MGERKRGGDPGAHHKKRQRKGKKIATEVAFPRDKEKAFSAAYLRMLGATQEVASENVGVAARTIRAWEGSAWWPAAETEARKRWLQGGDALAMRGITRGLRSPDDKLAADTAKWWADRRLKELAPPSQRTVVSGNLGVTETDGAVDLSQLTDEELDDYERLLEKATKPTPDQI